jgi:hypothetical protein
MTQQLESVRYGDPADHHGHVSGRELKKKLVLLGLLQLRMRLIFSLKNSPLKVSEVHLHQYLLLKINKAKAVPVFLPIYVLFWSAWH